MTQPCVEISTHDYLLEAIIILVKLISQSLIQCLAHFRYSIIGQKKCIGEWGNVWVEW